MQRLHSQQPWDTALPTSGLAPALAPSATSQACTQLTGTWPHPPASWHQSQTPWAAQPVVLGPSPAHQWTGSHCTRQCLAANRARHQPRPPVYIQESPPPQQKGLHNPQRGPLQHIALATRRECAAGPHRTSPTKSHFFKFGKHNQPTYT